MSHNIFYYYYNGRIGHRLEEIPLYPLIRATFFGENPFTSFLMSKGAILLWEEHVVRLKKTFELFYPNMSYDTFLDEVLVALKEFSQNEATEKFDFHVRVMFGFETTENNLELLLNPLSNLPNYTIRPIIFFKEIGQKIGSDELILKVMPRPKSISTRSNSGVKLGDYALSLIDFVNLRANEDEFSEILCTDNEGILIDSLFSSVIVVSNTNEIIIPKLRDGILDGVTRRALIKFLNENKISYNLRDIELSYVKNLKAIYLLNGVRGCQKVGAILFGNQKMLFNQTDSVIEEFQVFLKSKIIKIEDLN